MKDQGFIWIMFAQALLGEENKKNK